MHQTFGALAPGSASFVPLSPVSVGPCAVTIREFWN